MRGLTSRALAEEVGGSLAGGGDAGPDRLISYDTALAPMVSTASEVSWHPSLDCILPRLSPENPDLPFCRSRRMASINFFTLAGLAGQTLRAARE